MSVLSTSSFTKLPEPIADGIFKKIQGTSTIARLCGAEPQKFGKSNVMTLTGRPKAELVGEGIEKSPSAIAFGNKQVIPYKFQTTIRLDEEVKWTDEDHQLEILSTAFSEVGASLGRALDLAAYHKLNPLSGLVAEQITEGICDTSNIVNFDEDSDTDFNGAIEQAAGLIIADGYQPTGLALDPMFAFGLSTQKDGDGYNLYPNLGFGQDLSNLKGMKAAVSDTVRAKAEAGTDTEILGIMGQFDAFRWGVQRDIAAHLIEFGDPDGQGDLQRLNQIAIRAEIVYGFGIMDKDAFVVISAADPI